MQFIIYRGVRGNSALSAIFARTKPFIEDWGGLGAFRVRRYPHLTVFLPLLR